MATMVLVNSLPKKRKSKATRKTVKSTPRKESKVMAKKAKRKTGKRKAHRTAAQKAATARMLAANKRGKKRRVVRVTSRRSTVQGQPVTERGRVRARKRKVKGYSANPMHKRRRKSARRSNPISLKAIPQTIKKVAMPVAVGVGASIALDKLMTKMPVPAMLQVAGKEKMRTAYLVGLRTALIIGGMMVGRKMGASKDTVDGAGVGALSVTFTDLARSLMPDHLLATAAVHGYDQIGGYDLQGIETLNGNADYMGGYDLQGINRVNAVN